MNYARFILAVGVGAFSFTESQAGIREAVVSRKARIGSASSIEYHLERGANPNRLVFNKTPLMRAVKYGNEGAVDALLKYNANVHAFNRKDRSALSYAAMHHQLNLATKIMERASMLGVKEKILSKRDRDGNTPLNLAVIYGSDEVALKMFDEGADPTIKNEAGENALVLATRHGRLDVLSKLVKDSSQANHAYRVSSAKSLRITKEVPSSESRSLLMESMYSKSSAEVTHYLIQQGAAVDMQDSRGDTALLMAARTCQVDKAQILLEAGHANPTISNIAGETPMQAAVRGSCMKIQEMLRQAGASL